MPHARFFPIWLILILISVVFPANGQFISLYGTTGFETSRGILPVDDYYILTSTSGSSATTRDGVISKVLSNGDIAWSYKYGASGDEEICDIRLTKDSCLIFVGYSVSSAWDGWIVKMELDGTLIWSKKMGGSSNEFFRTVYQTADSGYLVGGATESYGGSQYNAWFIKLDKNGDLVWNKTIGGSQVDYGMYPIEMSSGNILWTFYTGGVSGGYGGYDWNLVKFTPSGSVISQRRYGSSGNEGIRDFRPCQDGSYWMIGETSKNSPGKGMVIRIDSSGDQIQRVLYTTPTSSHLDFYTGYPTADSGLITAGYLGSDAIVVKLDNNMDVEWAKTYVASNNQLLWNIIVTDDKSAISTGYSNQFNSTTGQDILLIKMDSAGLFDCRNHNQTVTIFSPGTNDYAWSSISLSTGSGGSVSTHSISTGSVSYNRKPLNLDPDSMPINLDGGQSNIKMCQVDSLLLLSTNKATEWTWSTGGDTSFIYVKEPDTVWVEASNGYCFNRDTAIVVYRDSVNLANGYDTLLCHGQIFTLTGSGTGGLTSKHSYVWRDSSSNQVLHRGASYTDTFFSPITLKLSLWDSCGMFHDSVYYKVRLTAPLEINSPDDTTVCAGESVLFHAYGSGGKQESHSYQWKNALSMADTLRIASDTSLPLFVTVNDGCSAPDTGFFTLITRLPLTATANGDTTICRGESARLFAQGTGGDSSYQYVWNQALGNGQEKTVSPASSTLYSCIVTDGCTYNADTVDIRVLVRQPLSVVNKPDTTVCEGEVFNLYALGFGGDSSRYTFEWNSGLDTGRSQQVSFTSSDTLRVILRDQCTSDPDTGYVIVTVRNPLQVHLPNDTLLCKGRTTNLNVTASGGLPGGYVFSWDNGLGTGAAKTVGPDTTTLYKVKVSDGCSQNADSGYIHVSIRLELSISMRSDTSICRGENVFLYAQALGGDSSYSYSWNQGIASSHPPMVAPDYTTTYRLIVTDNCTVKDDTAEVRISVRDSLSVVLNSDTTICRGQAAQLRASRNGGYSPGYTLNWNPSLSGDSVHVVSPEYPTTYRVILSDNCTSQDDTAFVHVQVRDSLSVTPRQDTTICIGEPVLLYAAGVGGLSSGYAFAWDNGVGSGNYLVVSPDTTTTYRVVLTDNCTSKPDTSYVTIFVRNPLSITQRSDTTICIGQGVLLSAQSGGGYASQHELTWNQGLGIGNYLFASPTTTTTYQVILRDYCTTKPDTAQVTIYVRNPLTAVERDDSTICIGESVDLYATGFGGYSNTYEFTWNHGIDTGRVVNVSPDTTTTYRLILSDGCTTKEDTTEVTIFVRPPLDITQRSDTFICVGEHVHLYAQGAGGYAPGYTYTWDNGLDTGNQNSVNPPVSQTYRVILTDGCTENPDTGFATVFVRMPLTLVKRTDTLICLGEEIDLYFDGMGGDSLHYTFIWNNGGGTGNHRKMIPDSSTTYTVSLTDNCTLESGVDSVKIGVRPPLEVTAREDSVVCIGEGVFLYSNQSGGYGPEYELTWNQGIGIDSVPLVYPDTTTTYQVILNDYCTIKPDTDYVTVQVRAPIEITQREDSLICIGEPVRLYASAIGGLDTNYTFTWDNGLDTGQGNVVYPSSSTQYRVIVSDGCTHKPDTGFVTIFVRDPLSVTPRLDTLICIGENVTLYASGQGGDSSYSYRWNGGVDTVDTPVASPTSTTVYEVILRDACTVKPDTAYMTVSVRDPLGITARTDTTICVGETVRIYSASAGGNSPTYETEWDQGGGIANSFTVQPGITTTYRVILRDFCTILNDTDWVTVTVRDSLRLVPRTDTIICIGETVDVYATASGGYSPAYTYTWNPTLPDGPRHPVSPTVSTQYRVILGDNCTLFPDTAMVNITVRQPLQLTVRTDTFICQGDTVILYASATGGDSLNYDFYWNQGIGSAVNPSVAPVVNTNYFVRLTDNCTTLDDTASVNIELPVPLTLITSNDTLICRNNPVVMSASGNGGLPAQYTYTWTGLGTGAQKTVAPGFTTTYYVQFSDDCAVPVNDSIRVNVQVPLVPGFVWDPEWACVPNEVTFKDTTGGSQDFWFRWEYGDGKADTGVNLNEVMHSFDMVGDYQVQLLLRSPLGCLDTSALRSFRVHPDPVASFTYDTDDNSGTDMSIRFTSTSKGATDYFWDYGDLSTDVSVENPTHAFASPDRYVIIHSVLNQWGCADSTLDTIDVKDTYRIFMPNAFTPSGSDTLNVTFGPVGTGIRSYELSIYDRWGGLVYFNDKSQPWDGRHQETLEPLPSGMYVYILRAFSTRDDKKTEKGIVYIIR